MKSINLSLLRLANGISEELTKAAHAASPEWQDFYAFHKDEFNNVVALIRSGQPSYHHPLVAGFVRLWAWHCQWPIINQHVDGLELKVPSDLVAPLTDSGMVDSFIFYLADRAQLCCATLGSNDHNKEYGLFINCPIFLELTSFPEHFECFSRQIRMVIHHEMAHFRYKRGDLRVEQIAHARGVASLLDIIDFPCDIDALSRELERNFPEVWSNSEIRSLLTDHGRAAWRLIRIWSYLNSKVS